MSEIRIERKVFKNTNMLVRKKSGHNDADLRKKLTESD